MKSNVNPIPKGYRTVTPYLIVENAAQVIEFIKKAFGAKELFRMEGVNGTVQHAEVEIGDSKVMISEVMSDVKPMPAMLHLYVEDVDSTYHQALLAGAKSLREPMDQFYGDRGGCVEDVGGNQWWIASHIEDVSMEELKRREEAMANK